MIENNDALMDLTIESEQEEDGRWIAEILELPGVLAYGQTPQEAIAHVQALALRVIADRIEHGEAAVGSLSISFAAARVSGGPRKHAKCLPPCYGLAGKSNEHQVPIGL